MIEVKIKSSDRNIIESFQSVRLMISEKKMVIDNRKQIENMKIAMNIAKKFRFAVNLAPKFL